MSIPRLALQLLRRASLAFAVLVLATNAFVSRVVAQGKTSLDPVLHQLRIYEIFESNKEAFHDRFRDHALRIMKRYDFHLVAMWETQSAGRTELAYILRWPDERTMTDRWSRFLADPEWIEIKKQSAARHGKLVGEIEDRVLRPTDYAPRLP